MSSTTDFLWTRCLLLVNGNVHHIFLCPPLYQELIFHLSSRNKRHLFLPLSSPNRESKKCLTLQRPATSLHTDLPFSSSSLNCKPETPCSLPSKQHRISSGSVDVEIGTGQQVVNLLALVPVPPEPSKFGQSFSFAFSLPFDSEHSR